jgi:hypothetical protein
VFADKVGATISGGLDRGGCKRRIRNNTKTM